MGHQPGVLYRSLFPWISKKPAEMVVTDTDSDTGTCIKHGHKCVFVYSVHNLAFLRGTCAISLPGKKYMTSHCN